MMLEIEQEHIDAADWHRQRFPNRFVFPDLCPIAQGLMSKGYEEVSVAGCAWATGHKWQLDKAAISFMDQWDRRLPVSPTTLGLVEV